MPRPEAIDVPVPGLMCFGCSASNQYGLQLNFFKRGHQVFTEFTPSEFLQGWFGAVHGGVLSTLIDELANFTVAGLLRRIGVTRDLQVHFRRPLYVNEPITMVGVLGEQKKSLVTVKCELSSARGDLCCEGEATVFLLERQQFERMIPGGQIPVALTPFFPLG